MKEIKSPIPSRIYNSALDGHVAGTEDIFDDEKNKSQKQINSDVEQIIGQGGSIDEKINQTKLDIIGGASEDYNTLKKEEDKIKEESSRIDVLENNVGQGASVDERIEEEGAKHYLKEETYNKEELNNLITTPEQNYVSVTATDQTSSVTDILPTTGAADTIYRVGNWDGTQYNDSVFSEYAWNGSTYIKLNTKSQVEEVYDISVNHATTKYADLGAALGTNGANIPQSLQKGGMSVKFIQSSDNKYVQYRLMTDTFSTTPSNWQGVDDEPVNGSDNIAKSSGIAKNYGYYKSQIANATQGISYVNNFTNIKIKTGQKFHVKATGDAGIISNKIINLFVNRVTDDAELGYITINGEDKSFVANEDITTLICYKNSTYVVASGTVTIELLIEGSVVNKQLSEIRENISALNGNVAILSESLDTTNKKAFGYKETFSKNSAGNVIKQFKIKTGYSYTLKNTDSYEITARTSDSNGNVIQWISQNGLQGGKSVTFVANTDASYVTVNCFTANGCSAEIFINSLQHQIDDINGDIQKELLAIKERINNNEVFVATTGDDTNDGTVNAPFATVAEAVSRGYKNICVKNGVYTEMLNFSGKNDLHIYAYNNITLTAGNKRTRPIFTNGTEYNTFVDEGNAIKSFELSTVPNKYNDVFINKTTVPIETYQGFANTVNAGLWGKCTNKYDDFIFKPVLTLEELNEDDTFYFDGTNVYFHTSKTIESVVVVGNNENVASFINCNNLVIEGLEFEYGYNDVLIAQKSNGISMNNCVFSHSLRRNNTNYDYSDITFINCLSYKARRDGFNAAICGISRLVNCNSLYNYDDGESSHEYCEVIVEGGEYAYNSKAGHAPVNGCKFKCSGTYTHHNSMYGFLLGGTSSYEMIPLIISDSVAINNTNNDVYITEYDVVVFNCKYNTTSIPSGNLTDLTTTV